MSATARVAAVAKSGPCRTRLMLSTSHTSGSNQVIRGRRQVPFPASDLLDHARAGWRYADEGTFTPLWPPGLERFDVS